MRTRSSMASDDLPLGLPLPEPASGCFGGVVVTGCDASGGAAITLPGEGAVRLRFRGAVVLGRKSWKSFIVSPAC
jgi:hypothetical protein